MRAIVNTPGQHLLYFLAFVSGACALTYEVIWFRLLANVCGSSVLAASIVSAVFLTGLAIGAALIGRLADRISTPLYLFALLEASIGALGLAVPFVITEAESILATPQVPISLILIFSVLILLLPTALMGGTLPVLSKCTCRPDNSEVLSRLYTVNTGGAAFGVVLVAFVLLPVFGQLTTIILAASTNGLVAITALSLKKRQPRTEGFQPREHAPLPHRQRFLALFASGLTGGCALALEILWLRLFTLYLGNTTYAFALVLGCFLFGIALGSSIYRRFLFERFVHWQAILFLLALSGVGIFITISAFDRLSFIFYGIELAAEQNWPLLIGLRVLAVAIVVFPTTIASGAIFPALLGLAGYDAAERGKSIGLFLGFNTIGSVVGSLAVPLFIIPTFGLQGGCRFVVFLLAALSLLIIVAIKSFSTWSLATPAMLCLIALLPFKWDQYLLDSGVYVYAAQIKHSGGLLADREKWRMLFHSEGVDATVAVFQEKSTGVRSFIVNGKVDGGTADMPTQVLLGQLPLLLHPSPKKSLVVGLGTGITLAETMKYSTNSSTCYEISAGVIATLPYFSSVNDNVATHTRAAIVRGDARRALLVNSTNYDVIISEPSNPWQTGNSRLFTRDFYRLARHRLNAGGLFCQWLPIYDLPPHLLAGAIATFSREFPASLSFLVYGTDLLLIGGRDQLQVDVPLLVTRWQQPSITETFRQIGYSDPFNFLSSTYLGGSAFLDALSQGAPINTDDANHLEFFRYQRHQATPANLRMILNTLTELSPATRFTPMIFHSSESGHFARQQLAQSYRMAGNALAADTLLQIGR